jgi:hypothetical protein
MRIPPIFLKNGIPMQDPVFGLHGITAEERSGQRQISDLDIAFRLQSGRVDPAEPGVMAGFQILDFLTIIQLTDDHAVTVNRLGTKCQEIGDALYSVAVIAVFIDKLSALITAGRVLQILFIQLHIVHICHHKNLHLNKYFI